MCVCVCVCARSIAHWDDRLIPPPDSLDDDEEEREDAPRTRDRDYTAVAALLFLYFGNMFALSIFETIGVPLTMDEFAWSPSTVSLPIGCVSLI